MKFNRKLLKLIAWISFITYFTPETGYAASTTKKSRVLIATPVRQTPDILREFLGSLKRLEANSYTAEYLFFDDNDNQESKELLISFSKQHGIKCKISTLENEKKDGYLCNENGHHWSPQLTWRVAEIKDRMIEHARNHSYDYLFLIDSDLILNPLTVDCLIEKNKDIISNIFWSFWTPDSMFLPQVWMRDHYTQYEVAVGEYPSKEEIHLRHFQFLEKMRTPGTYKVGGLGACTLINKATLNKGISFKELKNCSYIGEDRHFCLRAAALDIDLFVDTHYPAIIFLEIRTFQMLKTLREAAR